MSKFDSQEFAKAIYTRRQAKGLSLRELAADLDIAYSTLHRVESGSVPEVETFLVLNAWLGEPYRLPKICKHCGGRGTLP